MSHGSHCPYRDFPRRPPANEQSGLPTDHFLRPFSGSCRLSLKLSVLALSPAHQFLINVIVKLVQGRLVKVTVLVHP
jgi:hypothetical protein